MASHGEWPLTITHLLPWFHYHLTFRLLQRTIYLNVILFFLFFFVECEFQPMASAHDNSFLLSDQDTKSVLV